MLRLPSAGGAGGTGVGRMTTGIAVAGVGVVRPTDGQPHAARVLRRDAVDLALADAGLDRHELDGYLHAVSASPEDLRYFGLSCVLNAAVMSGGASGAAAMMLAAGAIAMGQVKHVVIVYSQAPSSTTMRTGTGAYGYPMLFGMFGPPATHALHARRHMGLYGTTTEQMGAVAVVQRDYGQLRPESVYYGQPITLEDHQASRLIVDPFRLLDCCRDVDIAVAVLVTSSERAKDLRATPVEVAGLGFGHNIRNWHAGQVYEHHDDIAPAAAHAFRQAGLTLDDVDVAELYDPHTMSVIMQLEHYGFCGPGEGGPFVADGQTKAGGRIPTNTAGGQLSGWYATGFTPLVEGIHQVRGTAGDGQLPGVDVALVSGHGGNAGVQNTWAHSTTLLTRGDR
jgi:acetyl-CoA acetyltransferase